MRRVCLVLVLAVFLGAASSASAEVPPGPRLAVTRFAFVGAKPKNPKIPVQLQLLTTGPLGEEPQVLVGSSKIHSLKPLFGLSWSPDGSTLAFPGGHSFTSLFGGDIDLVNADGTGLRRLARTGNASYTVFSADGRTIYFERSTEPKIKDAFAPLHTKRPKGARAGKSSIWAIGVDGSGLRRLTPPRRSFGEHPTSVSPVTGQIAVSRASCQKRKCRFSSWLLDPSTRVEVPLGRGIQEPSFSPDGREIAFDHVSSHAVTTAAALGGPETVDVRDLATGATVSVAHSREDLLGPPSWDPSGQRIAYPKLFGRYGIFEVNSDGTCLTPATLPARRDPTLFYLGVAWQPGAGREAGRIAC